MRNFNIKSIPYIIIFLLLGYIFLTRSCENKIVPLGKQIVKFDTVYKPVELPSKIITKYKNIKGDIVYLPGKVDTVEIKTFEKAPDTVKVIMYADATKIRQYKNEFNDSLADVSIFTETKGELLKIAPTITIKARLPEKKTVFALYGGFEISNNLEFTNQIYKTNLRFQNKRGDLFSGGYDNNKNIYLGYDYRFINIKK